MLTYLRRVQQAKRDEGASAVEYGLLVAAIAALIVVVVFALGNIIEGVFNKTCTDIESKVPVQVEAGEGCPEGTTPTE